MNELICYKTLPEWDFHSLPEGFRKPHNTKVGTWAKLRILAGKLRYFALDEETNVVDSLVFDTATEVPFVAPQAWHRVEPLSKDLRCQLAFYCRPEDYFQKKYQLSAVHSEVLAALNYIEADNAKPGTALDFGCGGGRNALFLQQQGFTVSAFDKNANAIAQLESIITQEKLPNITSFIADAQQLSLAECYDLVVCTVVLMFLPIESIPDTIKQIQSHTNKDGYNIIVCAMDTDDYPLSAHTLPFEFGFKPNELANYYADWEIKKYNEDIGHLHRKDTQGNPIELRFASLIARKA